MNTDTIANSNADDPTKALCSLADRTHKLRFPAGAGYGEVG